MDTMCVEGVKQEKEKGAMIRKWTGVLIGVMVVIGLWGVEAYAADKNDQGPPSPDRNWQIGLTPSSRACCSNP